ncbi:P63C domain-containing protein [Myxococcus sp. CA040A]|uniref:P63C domain-containing protein n=1 Tax=Myxococcus sp. CA040A TaxID=2741738 RepID=UPI00157AA810|nr:P63C domain-containing protein [Myxococcus sp. CA040A]NTX09054.1 hypothetical protein [Myxococcus sp. CA040A]
MSDETRVFSQAGMIEALGMVRGGSSGTGGTRLSRFVAQNRIKPYLSGRLAVGPFSPISFRPKGGGPEVLGYDATLLAEIASAIVRAAVRGALHKKQHHIGERAAHLLDAFAKLGVIGTVDEATGYQKERAADAMQRKLDAYLSGDMREWGKMFPDDFWEEMARLEGLDEAPKVRPLRWGKYVMAFIYDAMDKDVGNKLREINPNPRFRKNHHQWLAEYGKDRLVKHLWQVIGVMKTCHSMWDFRGRFAHVFKNAPLQLDWTDQLRGAAPGQAMRA